MPLGLAAGWIAYSNLAIDHAVPLPRAIDSEAKLFLGETSGALTYYFDRRASGRPLVLLHSINAAGSSYEMRPLFEYFRISRPVYALDLPGFGSSERPDRVYSPQLYTDAILDFLQTQVGEPADVIALSLSAEFAARAALAEPERFHSLAMISPTGFTARPARANGTSRRLQRLFAFPLWAQAFYDLIATQPSIHYFLAQSFVGPVDPGLERYAYATSHQPGARYAPLYFVSGALFTPEVRDDVYAALKLPVTVLYDRDPFVRFDTLPDFLREHTNWRAVRITPSRGLPQFERLVDVVMTLDDSWRE